MPARKDVDPVEMRFVLGYVALIDVLPDPLRFRVRLQGTELDWWLGCDLTGRGLDELPLPETRALAEKHLRSVAETGHPQYVLDTVVLDEMARRFEALILPLAGAGDAVGMILAAVRCHK